MEASDRREGCVHSTNVSARYGDGEVVFDEGTESNAERTISGYGKWTAGWVIHGSACYSNY